MSVAATLGRLARALQLTAARARIRRVTADQAGALRLQVELLRGELRELDCYQAGLAVVPGVGTEGLVISPGGDRGLGIVAALVDRKHRPTDMQPGEVALYDLAGDGTQIRIERGGVVRIRASQLIVEGEVADQVETLSAMRTVFNSHTHPGDGSPPDQQMGGGS